MNGYNEEAIYTVQPTGGDEFAMAMLAAFGVVMLIGFVLSLLMYIFYGIGMSKIAQKEGHPYPWLSWVPIVNMFMIPMSAEADAHGWLKGRLTKIYVGAYLFGIIVSFSVSFVIQLIPMEMMLLFYIPSFLAMSIPALILFYGFYFIVERYSENKVLHMIVAFLSGGASVPFQLFRWRNRESVYEVE